MTMGYRLNSQETGWEYQHCPWPQVVLRRLVHYPAHLKKLVQDEEWHFEHQSRLLTLPRRLGNKWGTYLWLQQFPHLHKYLPKTRIMRNIHDMVGSLDSMKDFYIKPVLGTQGERIIRVKKTNQGFLLAAHQKQIALPELNEFALVNEVQQLLDGKQAVIQETIQVMRTIHGDPVDLRYLVQTRAEKLNPAVFTVVRVARQGEITTNLHNGGIALSVRKASELIPAAKMRLWQRGVERGEAVARDIFLRFLQQYPYLSELGIDLAVDQDGHVYWMEINPCPGRRMLREVSPQWRIKSLERIVDYAHHIVTRNH